MLHKKTDHLHGDPLFLCRPGGFELPDQQHDSGSDGGKPPRTSSGGNLVGGFLNRNERAPQCGVATIEVAEQEFESPCHLLFVYRKCTGFTEVGEKNILFALSGQPAHDMLLSD